MQYTIKVHSAARRYHGHIERANANADLCSMQRIADLAFLVCFRTHCSTALAVAEQLLRNRGLLVCLTQAIEYILGIAQTRRIVFRVCEWQSWSFRTELPPSTTSSKWSDESKRRTNPHTELTGSLPRPPGLVVDSWRAGPNELDVRIAGASSCRGDGTPLFPNWWG